MSFCPTDRLADDKMESSEEKKKQILIENMSSGGAEIGWIRHMNERKMNEK